jgi:hypothetical protein
VLVSPKVTWRRRILRAVLLLTINAVFWVVIPSFVYQALAGSLPTTGVALSPIFIYTFGVIITGLQVLAALTEGMTVSVPLATGSHIASAYYIWAAVDGGILAVSQAGIRLTLSFQPLLFLLVLPSLFGAVRVPLNYLLEDHEAANPAAEDV